MCKESTNLKVNDDMSNRDGVKEKYKSKNKIYDRGRYKGCDTRKDKTIDKIGIKVLIKKETTIEKKIKSKMKSKIETQIKTEM